MKSKTTAIVLEIVFGIFGIFGIGWFYAGNKRAAAWWFFGMLVYLILQIFLFIATVTLASCVMYPLQLCILGVDVYRLNDYFSQQDRDIGGILSGHRN